MRTLITDAPRGHCADRRRRPLSSSGMTCGAKVVLAADDDDPARTRAWWQRGHPDAGTEKEQRWTSSRASGPSTTCSPSCWWPPRPSSATRTPPATDADVAHALDSDSMLMVPVFALAALPILWRRRHTLAAIAVSVVVLGVQRAGLRLGDPLWLRPAALFALAYAVARFVANRQHHLVGLAGIAVLQAVTLVKDASTDGISPIVGALPIAAVGLLRHRPHRPESCREAVRAGHAAPRARPCLSRSTTRSRTMGEGTRCVARQAYERRGGHRGPRCRRRLG